MKRSTLLLATRLFRRMFAFLLLAATFTCASQAQSLPPFTSVNAISDPAISLGPNHSQALINGRPAIAFTSNTSCQYVRANDASGTSWGSIVTVDTTLYVSKTVLLQVHGRPAICYAGRPDPEGPLVIKYVRANDAAGSSWGAPVVLATPSGSIYAYADFSIAMVNGRPAVTYPDGIYYYSEDYGDYLYESSALRYVRADDATGSSWGTPVDIVTDEYPYAAVASGVSLAVVNGNPAVAFTHYSDSGIRLVRADDLNGATWGTPVTTALLGSGKLMISGGNPVIGTSSGSVSRATNANGTSWSAPVTIGSGWSFAYAVVNGRPAACYYSPNYAVSASSFRYVQANDAAATSWGSPVSVDNTFFDGQYSSLIDLGGQPAMAYYKSGRGAEWAAIIVPRPVMTMSGNGSVIENGDLTPSTADHTDFGNSPAARTFTITNSGNAALTLTGTPKVEIIGENAADFTVTTQPAGTVASGGGTTTFSISFSSADSGARNATVRIVNDAIGEECGFAIRGIGSGLPPTSANITANNWRLIYMNAPYVNGGSNEAQYVYAVHANRQENTVYKFDVSPYYGATATGDATLTFTTAADPGTGGGNHNDYTLELLALNAHNTNINLDNATTFKRNVGSNLSWIKNDGSTLAGLNYNDSVLDIGTVVSTRGPLAGDSATTGPTPNTPFTMTIPQATLQAWFDQTKPAAVVITANVPTRNFHINFSETTPPVLSFSTGPAVTPHASPAGTDKAFTLNANETYQFTLADFGFSDSDVPPDAFTGVKITTIPSAGTLTLGGSPITAGQTVSTLSTPAGTTWDPLVGSGTYDYVAIGGSANGTKLFASAWNNDVFLSSDGGATWAQSSLVTTNRIVYGLASSADGTRIYAAPRYSRLYVSDDSGATWSARDSSRFWNSIACSADGMKAVACDGDNGFLYTTTDGGATWTPRTTSGNRPWAHLASSADGTKLIGVVFNGQIQISTDSGATWTARDSARGWVGCASSADGSKLTAVVENGFIYTSADSGATWTPRMTDANRSWHRVACSGDGAIVTAVELNGKIRVSTDSGVTWTDRASSRGWRSVFMTPDGSKMLAGAINTNLQISSPGAPVLPLYTAPASGGSAATFTFQVQDNGSTDNGGANLDPTPNTMTMNIVGVPEIAVEQPVNSDLGDGTSSIAFGTFNTGGSSAAKTFTVRNSGTASLSISGVNVMGGNASDFAVNTSETSASVAVGGSTTFSVAFSPSAPGLRSTTLRIQNTDSDENPFDITLTGNGNNAPVVTLNGATTITTEAGASFSAPNATANDVEDGALVPVVTGTVNTAVPGTYILTYTATDSGGLTDAKTRTINVVDTTAPAVAAHANVGPIEATSASGAVVNYDAGSAADFIGVTSLAYSQNSGTVFPIGTTTVTITARDAANNVGTGTFTVTVADTTAPTVAAHANVGPLEGTSLAGAVITYAPGSATDDVGVTSLTYSQASGTTFPIGTTTVTITARDAANNVGTGTFTVTVTGGPAAPSGADKAIALNPGGTHQFTLADFGFSDSDLPPNNFSAVKINTLPALGTLTLGGLAITENQTISMLPTAAGETWTTKLGPTLDTIAIGTNANGNVAVAGQWGGYLQVTTDGGATWTPRMTDTTRNFYSVSVSDNGQVMLIAPRYSRLYTSHDGGVTWVAREQSRFFVPTAMSGDGMKMYAGDGNPGQLYVSSDSGVSWSPRLTDMNRAWSGIGTSADGTKAVACAFNDYIYTSTDSGATWTKRMGDAPRVWSSCTMSADGTKLFATVDNGKIYTSTDSGATWTAHESDRRWLSVSCTADGVNAAATELFGNIYVSNDSGVTWAPKNSSAPWRGVAVSDDGSRMWASAGLAGGGRVDTSGAGAPVLPLYTAPIADDVSPSFTFQVQDDAVITGLGSNLDPTPNTFTFNINDVISPVVDAHANVGPIEATSASGAVVTYDAASASDDVGVTAITYSHNSGTVFPIGTTTVTITAYDGANNTGTSTFTVTVSDTTAPDTSISSGPAMFTNTTGATFTFTGSDAVASAFTFEASLDGGDYLPTTSPLNVSDLREGQHTLAVRAKDAAGNTDASPATHSWTVDTTAPDTAITATPASLTNSTTGTFSFSSEAGATFEVSVDGGAFAAAASPFTITALGDGTHTFEVRAVDAAGNTDASPASYLWTVDATAPETTITSGPAATVTTTNTSVSFTSNDANATFEISLDGAPFVATTSPRTFTGLTAGAHTIAVRAIDTVGNVDPTPATRSFTVALDRVGAGTYFGYLERAGERIGIVRYRMTATGFLTGYFHDDTGRKIFRTKLNASGVATGQLHAFHGGHVFTFTRQTLGYDVVLGSSTGLAERTLSTPAERAAAQGNYNVVLPTGTEISGFSTMRVLGNGLVNLAGRLPDGTAHLGGAVLMNDGRLPIFLQSRGHSVIGDLTLANLATSDVSGTLTWKSTTATTNLAAHGARSNNWGGRAVSITLSGGSMTTPIVLNGNIPTTGLTYFTRTGGASQQVGRLDTLGVYRVLWRPVPLIAPINAYFIVQPKANAIYGVGGSGATVFGVNTTPAE